MQWFLDLIFTRELWAYDPRGDWYSQPYHWINLVEGTIWLGVAVAVMVRWFKFRKTWLEWMYAALFVVFGLTDFREAMVVHGWLIWLKAAILVGILWTRWRLRRGFYRESRTL